MRQHFEAEGDPSFRDRHFLSTGSRQAGHTPDVSDPRPRLPIYALEDDLVRQLHAGRRLVVEAPTGSGKSTQVPQMLVDRGLAPHGRVVVLQPRRLAARMLARRVAEERGVTLGAEVGYQVRFENRSSRTTRVLYETDGILLREALRDPSLATVSAILFDEFHERHLYADVMLGLASRLQRDARPDLTLLVMSATLDSRKLLDYLGGCPVARCEGRTFPVAIEYLPRPPRPDEPVWELAARELERITHGDAASGDTLIFMPGAYEIRQTVNRLQALRAARGCRILPLHGELPAEEQDAALRRYDGPKIVVATNVAETSLTIEGVTRVVDSGLARKARFDPNRGIDSLLVEKISRAAADQRAGRAGRTTPGRCVRLWTERDHQERPAHETPEIQRVDLSEILLALLALGVRDPREFAWVDPPNPREVDRALAFLQDLGAVGGRDGRITALGRRMLAFPVHPRHARILLAAHDYGCVPSVALIAALTQERGILLPRQPREVLEARADALGDEHDSDVVHLLRAWRHAEASDFSLDACRRLGIHAQAARRAGQVWRQFMEAARALDLDTREDRASPDSLRKCLLAGFADRVARRASPTAARCDLVHRRRGSLDAESVVRKGELLVAAEIHEIGRHGGETEVRLSLVTAIERDWLAEMFPDDVTERVDVRFDPATKRVVAHRETLFRDLVLTRSLGAAPEPEAAARVLTDLVLDGTLTLKEWDQRVEQWIARANLLAARCPELGIAAIGDPERRALIERVCLGSLGYKELKDKPVWPTVRAWLPPAQHGLIERHAPERITLSNGRTPKVLYDPTAGPTVAIRIQDLYGVTAPVTLAMGRVRLVFQILGPNHRPVQVTDDPGSFWRNHYPAVKRELQRRYPKHEWR
jgi:ATP-dependent helicase HrpB